jgi:HK97 family phage prohead protease
VLVSARSRTKKEKLQEREESSEMKETRYLVARELRATGSGKGRKIEGYAATWNTQADLGNFLEVIAAKPFSSLESDEVVMLFNHDDNLILGRSGVNLELTQDQVGLKFVCTLNDSSVSTDCYANLKSGILKECSFAFTVNPNGESWSTLPDGKMLRTLKDLKLWDCAVVTSPAYQGTSAAARNVVADDIEARMSAATRAASTGHLGVVPFSQYDNRNSDSFDSVDEANEIINWADGEDEDRTADAPVKNRLKAAQGFLYVKNAGEKRSDYVGPHHTIVDGQLAHSQIGTLRCARSLASGKLDIPQEHRAAAKDHVNSEMNLWFGDGGENDSQDGEVGSEIERSRNRLRLEVAKLNLSL